MRFLIVPLFSLLAVAMAAPSTNTNLTSLEEVFLYDSSYYDFDILVKQLSYRYCVEKNIDFQAPLEIVTNRIKELLNNKDVESSTVCTLLKTKLTFVTEPIVKVIDKDCLSKALSGAAEFAIKALVSLVTEICDSTVEEIMELANPCLSDFHGADLENCLDKADRRHDNDSFQDDVCRAFAQVRPCVDEVITNTCKLQITRESVTRFLDSVVKRPCSS